MNTTTTDTSAQTDQTSGYVQMWQECTPALHAGYFPMTDGKILGTRVCEARREHLVNVSPEMFD